MSDALSFVEIDGQRVELLPARNTLIIAGPLNNVLGNLGGDGGGAASSGDAVAGNGSSSNVQEPTGGTGGGAQGGGVLGGVAGYDGTALFRAAS